MSKYRTPCHQKQMKSAEYYRSMRNSQKLKNEQGDKSLLSKNQNIISSSSKINEADVKSVLSQLKKSSQILFFEKYQRNMESIFEMLVQKVVVLQFRIASLQKNMNLISLDLRKKCCQIGGVYEENQSLKQLNSQVEEHLQRLREQYKFRMKEQENFGLQHNIEQLKKVIEKTSSPSAQTNQTLIQIRKVVEKMKSSFAKENQQVFTQVMDTVSKIIQLSFSNVPMEESLSQYVQAKIIENIEFKASLQARK